jgi:GcrA cell cycle regulator
MDWTEERIEALRSLWMQGLTASQIAERLGGVSRNAVIGKAHRLGLSARPSPIKREPGAKPVPMPRPARVAPPQHHHAEPAPMPAAPPPPQPQITAKAPGAAPAGGSKGCMWPIGDPKQAGFHFCGAPSEPGRPYCTQHCAAAYHKRQVDAA